MLTGVDVRLRPWREGDIPIMAAIRNDIALQAQLLSRVKGSSFGQVRKWLEYSTNKENRIVLIITDGTGDQVVGFIQVDKINSTDCHADLGICLLEEYRGRGLGGQAIILMADYLQSNWQLRKLVLQVRADNTAALRCYEKAGFERCGLLRQHIFIEGKWWDIVLMEYFIPLMS